jgi:MFS family permease
MVGMGAGVGTFLTATSYFIKPLHAAFGWSRGEISLASFAILLTSLTMPVVGVLVDRYGPRAFILAGSLMFCAAHIALSMMNGQIWVYFAILLFIGVAAAPATAPLVFTQPLVAAFAKSRGLAIALAYSGGVIVSFVLQPTLQHTIATYGWRAGYQMLAPVALGLGVASFALLGRRSKAQGSEPVVHSLSSQEGLSLGGAAREGRFWLLGLSMVCMSLASGAFGSQLQALLSDLGVPGPRAALLGVWYAASVSIGQLVNGSLLDRLWPPGVGFVALSVPVGGLLLFLGGSPPIWLLALALLLVGYAFGAEGGMLAFFTARYFGLKSFGAIFGVLGMALGVSVAIGGASAGFLFDLRHNYHLNLQLGSALAAISATCLLASGLLSSKGAATGSAPGQPLPLKS